MKLFVLGASVALADNNWLRKEWEVQDAYFAGEEIVLSDPTIRSNKQWHDCGDKPPTPKDGESVRCSGAYCAAVCPMGWRSQGRWRIKCQADNTWSHSRFSPCITCPDISDEVSQINAQTQLIYKKGLPITQFFCGKSTDQLLVGNDLFKGQNPKKNLKCLCRNGQHGNPDWKKSCEWEFMGEQWRPAGPMVASVTCKPKEYQQFCIVVKSSPDEDLCHHHKVKNGHRQWSGDDITITQNGKKIATMKTGTRTFKHCLSMEDVDVENDVFQFTNGGNDGVCINSLEINKQIVTVGMNDQPNFWLDGNDPNCGSTNVATPQISIQNGEVTATGCSGDFCVRLTSSASGDLCYHPLANGPKNHKGNAITVTQNGQEVATVPAGFTDFGFCLDGVDAENDEFQFSSTGSDGVCVTSLTMGDDQVFAGSDNDQPSFWIDGDNPNCFPNHVATEQMTVVNGQVTASECDPAFCIMITSSADEDLCEHPKGGPSAWKGNDVEIFQNGNKVGEMPTGTKMFRFCLPYDQVNVENDVFKLARSGDDGVCITSLSVDGTDILVGPNGNQPNFWIDGDDNDCTDDFVSTDELFIQNSAVISSECDPKFCIEMTSSADQDLCQHPVGGPKDFAGGPISIKQNGYVIGEMKRGTKDFKLCLDYDQVNIENDIFELHNPKIDGACITSLTVDGNAILFGDDNQPNFWLDGDDNDCRNGFVSTQKLTVQNNALASSECDPKFCIEMTSSADQDLCQHPVGGPKDYAGGPITIKQNGNVIGSMKRGAKDFKLCLEYDQVNIQNDIFELHNPKSDGACITSLTVDGNPILFGENNQPNFWLDGDDNDCEGDFVSTSTLTVQNNVLTSSECDPKFCIEITSSADQELCQHPIGGPKDYAGGPISITQNGNVIGSMKRGTKDFKLCLPYDQVDVDNDVFVLANSKSDGACLTSLTVDGTAVQIGNGEQNFWLDGDNPYCTSDTIATPEITIVGGVATSIESCPEFCINVTSGLNQGLCDHPKWPNAWEKWSGGNVTVNYNGNKVATMATGFTDFEYCMPRWSVDVANDEFQLSTPHTKGVCVTSFTVDDEPILVGPNGDLPSFWLDNNVDCLDSFVATTQVTVKNGQVTSSYCDNDLYCIKVTSGLDLEKCAHPSWPNAAANGWTGKEVQLKHNGRTKGRLFEGFTEFEFCLIRSEVDIENDKFQLVTEHNDGICVTGMTVDGEQVRAGRNKDLTSFWLDDNVECRDSFMASTQVTVQNGEVISDYCN